MSFLHVIPVVGITVVLTNVSPSVVFWLCGKWSGRFYLGFAGSHRLCVAETLCASHAQRREKWMAGGHVYSQHACCWQSIDAVSPTVAQAALVPQTWFIWTFFTLSKLINYSYNSLQFSGEANTRDTKTPTAFIPFQTNYIYRADHWITKAYFCVVPCTILLYDLRTLLP